MAVCVYTEDIYICLEAMDYFNGICWKYPLQMVRVLISMLRCHSILTKSNFTRTNMNNMILVQSIWLGGIFGFALQLVFITETTTCMLLFTDCVQMIFVLEANFYPP